MVLLTLSFFPFRLSAALLSRAMVITSSSNSLVGDSHYRIHWTILPMSCFNFKLIIMFSHIIDNIRICISILIPQHSYLVGGRNLTMMIFRFKCFDTGYPIKGFVLDCCKLFSLWQRFWV